MAGADTCLACVSAFVGAPEVLIVGGWLMACVGIGLANACEGRAQPAPPSRASVLRKWKGLVREVVPPEREEGPREREEGPRGRPRLQAAVNNVMARIDEGVSIV